MRWIVAWAFNTLALFVATWLLSGVAYGDDWWTLFIAGAIFTVVNAFLKPILTILSFPFIVVTLGLFIWLINALMLWITSFLVPPFDLEGFWKTIGAAFILWIANMVLGGVMRDFIEKPQRETVLLD